MVVSSWRVSGWLPTNRWNQLLRLTGTHEAWWRNIGNGWIEWRLELSSHFVGDHQSQEKIRAHIWRFPKMRGIPKSSKSFRLFDLKPIVTWVSSMTPSLDNTQGFIWRPLGGLKAATVPWPQWLAFCYHLKSYVAMIPWDHHVFSRNIANYSNLPGHTSHIQPHLSSSPVPGRPSPRLGMGLPLCRLYTKYLGGSLQLMSVPGAGGDGVSEECIG